MKYEVEKYGEELKALNETIWEAAELKFEEVRSMKAMADLLKGHGFSVETGTGGIPTAFRAVYGSGSPVIGNGRGRGSTGFKGLSGTASGSRNGGCIRLPGGGGRQRKDHHGRSRRF